MEFKPPFTVTPSLVPLNAATEMQLDLLSSDPSSVPEFESEYIKNYSTGIHQEVEIKPLLTETPEPDLMIIKIRERTYIYIN